MRALAGLLLAAATAAADAGTAALIIDDLGYSRSLARRALALPPPVNVAVLPHAPHSRRIAEAAVRAESDVLVHMPMEARGEAPTADMLQSGMAVEDFRARVARALGAVPEAVGLNNHMGSRLTGQAEPMARLMRQLAAARDPLLFVDSRTAPGSLAEAAARRAGLGVARRDVFLDHERDPAAIELQVRRWLRQARTTGCALAIGHPYPETLAVLERLLPRADDVRRVNLRTYVRECGSPARDARTRQARTGNKEPAATPAPARRGPDS